MKQMIEMYPSLKWNTDDQKTCSNDEKHRFEDDEEPN